MGEVLGDQSARQADSVLEAAEGVPVEHGTVDAIEGSDAEITAEFRRRLAGRGAMRRSERAAALQAAKDWRACARRLLQARRDDAREARRIRRIWQVGARRLGGEDYRCR